MAVDATIESAAGDHIVQFYERDAELVEFVGRWLQETSADDVSIVVATKAHRELFAAAAQQAESPPRGQVIWLDAASTLCELTVAGEINRAAFEAVVGGVIRRAQTGGAVRAYCEMVALLWEAGHVAQAIKLEGLWNELATRTPFALLCAYPSAIHDDPARARALAEVCDSHSACHHSWADAGSAAIEATASQGAKASFSSRATAPGYARRVIAQALRQWGYSSELIDDAKLVVSELVTNAVLHANSHLTLSVARTAAHGLQIGVHDASPLQSRTQPSPFRVDPRRGLGIVAALSDEWGIESLSDGKTVWAVLAA